MNTKNSIQNAKNLYNAHQWVEGALVCEGIIREQKSNLDAALLLSYGYANTNRNPAAEGILRKVIEVQPNNLEAQNLLATVLANLGRFAEASKIIREALLKIQAPHFGMLKNLAFYLYKAGKISESMNVNLSLTKLNPADPEPWSNVSTCLLDLQKPNEVLESLVNAEKAGHQGFVFKSHKGKANGLLGRHNLAAQSFSSALALLSTENAPDALIIELKYRLAHAQFADQQFREAHHTLNELPKEAIEQYGLLPLWAQSAFMSGQFEAALQLLNAAILQFPDRWDLYYSLTRVLLDRGHENAADTLLSRVPAQAAHQETYHTLMGSLKLAQKDYAASKRHFEPANQLAPDDFEPILGLFSITRHTCDFDLFNQLESVVLEKFRSDTQVSISPFLMISLPQATPTDHLEAANRQALTLKNNVALNFPAHETPKSTKGQKIRVGFLTNDFRRHATGFLFQEHSKFLNHTDFEWHLFHWDQINEEDSIQAAMRANMDRLHDISKITDYEAARMITEQQIDILIDIKGYTKGCRPLITAQNPAPISVNWLAFPCTMGNGITDYIIIDDRIASKDEASHFSESSLKMQHTYFPVPSHASIGDALDKAQHRLPSEGFVFGCFNQHYKITLDAFDAWCRILANTPKSVLWLLHDNEISQRNLIAHAAIQGIDANRIVFAPFVRYEDNLARLQHMDLMLDTFYYNGHTTSADALSQGVPVLTKMGDAFPARVSASLLYAADLKDLVTTTVDEYIQLAIKIAHNKRTHQKFKKMLSKSREGSALFNSQQFVADFETLLRKVASAQPS